MFLVKFFRYFLIIKINLYNNYYYCCKIFSTLIIIISIIITVLVSSKIFSTSIIIISKSICTIIIIITLLIKFPRNLFSTFNNNNNNNNNEMGLDTLRAVISLLDFVEKGRGKRMAHVWKDTGSRGKLQVRHDAVETLGTRCRTV